MTTETPITDENRLPINSHLLKHDVVHVDFARWLEGQLAQAAKGYEVARRDFRLTLADLTKARIELLREREKIRKLRDALAFIVQHGGMTADTELGEIKCDGFWCAEQARAALYTTEDKP